MVDCSIVRWIVKMDELETIKSSLFQNGRHLDMSAIYYSQPSYIHSYMYKCGIEKDEEMKYGTRNIGNEHD